jgi:N-acetylglutamate synthase
MNHRIETMSLLDFDQATRLWQGTEGVGLNESDSRECIGRFLIRNPEMSFVVRNGTTIVGAVLCGHDGRRGYLHHLAVAKSHRKRGIGKSLVAACLMRLEQEGILRCNIFLLANNVEGEAFWKRNDWNARVDLLVMQKPVGRTPSGCGC